MPEENRVFDVARPGRGQPQATSKPVIVGHHPVINDPMVNDEPKPSPVKIAINGGDPLEDSAPVEDKSSLMPPENKVSGMQHHDIPVYDPPAEQHAAKAHVPSAESSAPAVYDSPSAEPAASPLAESAPAGAGPQSFQTESLEPPPPDHVEALQPSPYTRRRNPLKWLIIILLLAAAAAYVLLGTGIIKSSLSLPPFNKKTNTASTSTPPASSTQTPAAQSSVPSGFTEYKLSGTTLTFAAPTAWGTPTSTNDPGYTKRGNNAQSDGTHAYLVGFPNNKDVEVAVTSNKYLPAARATQYYDYLQWCTGTADNKTYFATLEFTTGADKTDTPSTVVCNQGPLTDAQKLSSDTIVELAVKNTAGQVIGDLYTKNLADPNLPVIRVKDAKSANSSQIKQLLNTVKVPAQ